MNTRDMIRGRTPRGPDIETEALAGSPCEYGDHGLWCPNPDDCECPCHQLAHPCRSSERCHHPLCDCDSLEAG
jgi:hypothetical protein